MTGTNQYDHHFFAEQSIRSSRSASRVAPILFNALRPASVLDVGCGVGAWIAAFIECGATDYLGIDGDYVDPTALLIPAEKFAPYDLAREFSLGRKYDLVLSLEVAEHLPAAAGEPFVACLAAHSDIVLFSAAIPGQMGTNHINCRPLSYWKKIFEREGYAMRDCLRGNLWADAEVDWWYAQNAVLFVKTGTLTPAQDAAIASLESSRPIDLVHPALFQAVREAAARGNSLERQPFRYLARRILRSVARRITARRRPAGAKMRKPFNRI